MDRLVKVWLKSGEEKWLLIHIELQAQEIASFPLRMVVYNVTLFLLYNQEVVSLAILGDDRPNWAPGPYVSERWGCRHEFAFRTVKLLDWRPHMAELLTSQNPIAHVIAAHLQALETTTAMEDRRGRKFELVRNLHKLGFDQPKVRKLFQLIDGMMILPKELEEQFRRDMIQIEQEERMPFVSPIELLAEERGEKRGEQRGRLIATRKGIETALLVRLSEAGRSLASETASIDSLELLEEILDKAGKGAPLEELQNLIRTGK